MKISRGFTFALIASISWAIQIIFERYVLKDPTVNGFTVLLWTTITELPYWLFIASRHTKEIRRINLSGGLLLFAITLISTIGVSITEYFALKNSLAINYSFLIRTVILFTILGAYVFLGEQITKKKIVLAIVILMGSYLLTTNGKRLSLSVGDMFTLGEAVLISIGNNVFGRMITKFVHTDIAASLTTILSIFPIVLLAVWQQAFVFPKYVWMIALIAVLSVCITTFRYKALKESSASFVTMVFSFTPVLVSLLSFCFLKETISSIQAMGGLLIVAAGIGVEKLKIS